MTIRTFPTYDIVKKEGNNFVWVEAAHDIQSAKKRVDELSRQSDAEFVIFNERTLQVVATFDTPCDLALLQSSHALPET